MKARVTALLALTTAAVAFGLSAPSAAQAHQLDAHHQHGFSPLYLLYNNTFQGTPLRCGSTMLYFDGLHPGTVEAFLPDLVTSPVARSGEYRRVFVSAQLEYHSGISGTSWQRMGDWKPWVYTAATSAPRSVVGWYDLNGRPTGARYSWSAWKGFYRVHFLFYWEYDGAVHDEWTGWCEVS